MEFGQAEKGVDSGPPLVNRVLWEMFAATQLPDDDVGLGAKGGMCLRVCTCSFGAGNVGTSRSQVERTEQLGWLEGSVYGKESGLPAAPLEAPNAKARREMLVLLGKPGSEAPRERGRNQGFATVDTNARAVKFVSRQP